MSGKGKREGSISIQSRVSIVDLAKMEIYWSSTGYNIKTMSQLVGWSVGLLVEVLNANGMMKDKIDSVAEANRYLESRGLHQNSMRRRNFKKISTAISFENLRAEGIDPQRYVPQQYNMLHNKNSVEPFEGVVSAESVQGSVFQDGEYEDIMREVAAEKEEVKRKQMERDVEAGKEMIEKMEGKQGGVSYRLEEDEAKELIEEHVVKGGGKMRVRTGKEMGRKEKEIRKRDEEVLKEMNRPIEEILAEHDAIGKEG